MVSYRVRRRCAQTEARNRFAQDEAKQTEIAICYEIMRVKEQPRAESTLKVCTLSDAHHANVGRRVEGVKRERELLTTR